MTKAQNKTQPTDVSVEGFIQSIDNAQRKSDAQRLLEIFADVTNLQAKMWGPSIIGYGRYRYKYESGREGEFFLTGFSPRKSNLVVYIMPGYLDLQDKLSKLGKHKVGKSCLYIKRLSDIDEAVLREVIDFGLQYMRGKYETWDA